MTHFLFSILARRKLTVSLDYSFSRTNFVYLLQIRSKKNCTSCTVCQRGQSQTSPSVSQQRLGFCKAVVNSSQSEYEEEHPLHLGEGKVKKTFLPENHGLDPVGLYNFHFTKALKINLLPFKPDRYFQDLFLYFQETIIYSYVFICMYIHIKNPSVQI